MDGLDLVVELSSRGSRPVVSSSLLKPKVADIAPAYAIQRGLDPPCRPVEKQRVAERLPVEGTAAFEEKISMNEKRRLAAPERADAPRVCWRSWTLTERYRAAPALLHYPQESEASRPRSSRDFKSTESATSRLLLSVPRPSWCWWSRANSLSACGESRTCRACTAIASGCWSSASEAQIQQRARASRPRTRVIDYRSRFHVSLAVHILCIQALISGGKV